MPVTWTHTESDPAAALQGAFAAAASGTWASLSSTDATRYMRALGMATLDCAQMIGSNYPDPGLPSRIYGRIAAGDYADRTRLYIASTVLRSPLLLCPRKFHVTSFVSNDGAAGVPTDPSDDWETGFPPLAIVAIVAVGVAGLVWVSENVTAYLDSRNARDAETQRMLGTQASALQVIDAHMQREAQAGKALPWSRAELDVIDQLTATQRIIAQKQDRPMPTPFQGAIESLGGALGSAVTIAAVVGGIYLLTRN